MDGNGRKRIWSPDATTHLFDLCFSKKYLKNFEKENYLSVWENLAEEFYKKFPSMIHLKPKQIRQRFFRIIREFEIGRYGRENDRYYELKQKYFNRVDELRNMGVVRKQVSYEDDEEDIKENSDAIFQNPELIDYENYLNWINNNIDSKNLTYNELRNDLKILNGKISAIYELLQKHFK